MLYYILLIRYIIRFLGNPNLRVTYMKQIITGINDISAFFCSGALIYGIIELMWRGYTHWTMLLLGGLSFAVIYLIEVNLNFSILIKCFAAASFITAAEFVTGIIVNVILEWNIWDYSDIFLNVAGQICPLFSFFWFLLSIPAFRLCVFLTNRIQSIR